MMETQPIGFALAAIALAFALVAPVVEAGNGEYWLMACNGPNHEHCVVYCEHVGCWIDP